jgi:2-isopropylmalate synthase
MTPESVGLTCNRIVIGKHSGRFALCKKLEEFGYVLNKEDLNSVYEKVTTLADEKKVVTDQDLLNLMANTGFTAKRVGQSMAAGS